MKNKTETVSVDIIGDHPHTGRRGTLLVTNGNVSLIRPQPFLPAMVRVEFGEHDACLAESQNIRLVKS